MPNTVFFSFSEADRQQVLVVKGRAVNPFYSNLNFRVKDLLKRWDTTDPAVIRRAITLSMSGTSRTIVFVGDDTHKSYWVPEEVRMTAAARKPIYAIRVSGSRGSVPSCLTEHGIRVSPWSEMMLQGLATK